MEREREREMNRETSFLSRQLIVIIMVIGGGKEDMDGKNGGDGEKNEEKKRKKKGIERNDLLQPSHSADRRSSGS